MLRIKYQTTMADIKLLLVEDDKNLAFMEKNTLEDIVGGYEIVPQAMVKMVSRHGNHSSQMLSFQILICLL